MLSRHPRLVFALTSTTMYVQIIVIFGLTLAWGVVVYRFGMGMFGALTWLPEPLQMGFAGGLAFVGMTFGLAVLVIVICWLFRLRIRPGTFHISSLPVIQWATYNFYIILHRYTVMNFIRATPLQPWFYRLLGAKMGKGVQINTTIIGDCNLLTVGDYTVIGGDATIICHSYERGKMVIQPVTLGRYVDIGLNSVIMPGCTIGDHAVVAAGAIVPKNTTIPANTVWAGIPARQIREKPASTHSLA